MDELISENKKSESPSRGGNSPTDAPSVNATPRLSVPTPTEPPKPTAHPAFNGHLVRTIVRPVLTIGATTVWCLFIWKGIDYPPEFQLAVLGAWGLWFGERAVKRIREQGQ